MKSFVYTEAGYNHKNEDSVIVKQHPFDQQVFLCALADGQGGQSGGELAAKIAVNKSIEVGLSKTIKQLSITSTYEEISTIADQEVKNSADAGYSTLINLAIINNFVIGTSCGDNAVILIQNDKYFDLTKNQYKNPPVGCGQAIFISFSSSLTAPFKLLIMSDGVWKYIGRENLIKISQNEKGNNLIELLLKEAKRSNGSKLVDDFTIALFEE